MCHQSMHATLIVDNHMVERAVVRDPGHHNDGNASSHALQHVILYGASDHSQTIDVPGNIVQYHLLARAAASSNHEGEPAVPRLQFCPE